jgi:hypothetical protein
MVRRFVPHRVDLIGQNGKLTIAVAYMNSGNSTGAWIREKPSRLTAREAVGGRSTSFGLNHFRKCPTG